MATRPGVHGRRCARFLGTTRVSYVRRPLARAALCLGLKQGELALAQEGNELGIPFEKIQSGEICWESPADLLEGVVVQGTAEINDVIEQKFHRVFPRIIVARTVGFRDDVGFNAEFLTQFAAQAVLIRLPRFHLATGKLPFQRKSTITPALTDQQPAPLLDQASYHDDRRENV